MKKGLFCSWIPETTSSLCYRPEPYCKKIKTFRVSWKTVINYADCIDYHFFPLLKLIGDVRVSWVRLRIEWSNLQVKVRMPGI